MKESKLQRVKSFFMRYPFGKKTVHMKNGKKFYISQGNADQLVKMIQDSRAQFMSFSDGEKLFVMINMHDVSYID